MDKVFTVHDFLHKKLKNTHQTYIRLQKY